MTPDSKRTAAALESLARVVLRMHYAKDLDNEDLEVLTALARGEPVPPTLCPNHGDECPNRK